MTQLELAKAVGVSRNYIAMVERGEKPLSSKLKDKLSKLSHELSLKDREANDGLVEMVNIASDHAGHYRDGSIDEPGTCLACAVKAAEIKRLNRVIDGLTIAIEGLSKKETEHE